MKKTISALLGFILCAGMLTSCGLSEEGKKVKDMIDELPSTYSEEVDDDLQKAEEAYNNLSADDKNALKDKKLNKLKDSRKQYVIDNTKTFGITPEEFVDRLRDQAKDRDRLNASYTATDNGDGTSDFEFDDKLFSIEWKGTIITDTEEITSLTAKMFQTGDDATDNAVLFIIEMGFISLIGEDKDYIEPISDAFLKAIKKEGQEYNYDGYCYSVKIELGGTAYMTMTPEN